MGSLNEFSTTACFVFVSFSFLVNFGSCSDWVEHGCSLYKMGADQLNFSPAVESCERQGAYLALPSSAEENILIWELFQTPERQNGLWLGCLQDDRGNWGCLDRKGQSSDTLYRNWSPSHSVSAPNKCAVMAAQGWADKINQWLALRCNDIKYYMCEKKSPQQIAGGPTLRHVQGSQAAKLLKFLEAEYLSKVIVNGQSGYGIKTDFGDEYKLKLVSRDKLSGRVNVEAWEIEVSYCK